MEGKITWLLLGFLASQCSCRNLRNNILNIPEPNHSLHDDIRLTPEQKMQMKERGFYTPGKWPLVNNLVTVPYYFDSNTVPADSIVRTNFKKAVSIYEAQTCIRWVEVPSTDTQHKVKIFRDGGCWSYVGKIRGMDNELSLGSGCEQIGTMLHEMGHCMGLFHTQSRPDRDQYVRVWLQNVQPGMEHNFRKSISDLYDVPYDYKSMMHYGNAYFSINGSYTLSTIDPNAMFAIGTRPDTFRYSDAAFLNRAYTCDKINAAKCPSVTCLNGGFVTQDCKCRCPENTVGDRCETVTGPFFSDVPKCGRKVTTEGEITSFIRGVSTTEKCIFNIEAPSCKLPSITFTYARFYWQQCNANQVTLEISRTYFGLTLCKAASVPIGKPIVADSKNAAVYSFTFYSGSPIYGFKANISFVHDPACGPPETTSSTTTTAATTTTEATSTTAPETTTTETTPETTTIETTTETTTTETTPETTTTETTPETTTTETTPETTTTETTPETTTTETTPETTTTETTPSTTTTRTTTTRTTTTRTTTTRTTTTRTTTTRTTTTRTTTTRTTTTRTTTTRTTTTRTTTTRTTTTRTTTTRTTTIRTTTTRTTTTRTTTTRTTTTRTMTTRTTTTPPLVSTCLLTELGANSFRYTTDGFPGAVAPNTKCNYNKEPQNITDVIFTKVQMSLRLNGTDLFALGDTYLSRQYTGAMDNFVTYHLWPTSLGYSAGSNPGEGFSVIHTPVTGLPTPCNGETINMADGESRIFQNPLVDYLEMSVSCAFKIEAPSGKTMSIQGVTLGLASNEHLVVKPHIPNDDSSVDVSTSLINTLSNNVIIYYVGNDTYTPWEMKVTVV